VRWDEQMTDAIASIEHRVEPHGRLSVQMRGDWRSVQDPARHVGSDEVE
jgi:hypothetical protein